MEFWSDGVMLRIKSDCSAVQAFPDVLVRLQDLF